MALMLLKVGFIMNVIAFLWVVCALILILVILIQKGRGGGLSGAFGGGMASGLLGSKTGDFLTWVTVTLVGLFLLLAIALAKFYKPKAVSDIATAPAPQTQPVTQIPSEQSELPVETELPEGTELPVETEMPEETEIEVNLP